MIKLCELDALNLKALHVENAKKFHKFETQTKKKRFEKVRSRLRRKRIKESIKN